MAEERRQNGGWQLSKGLSVSHIIATAMAIIGFFTYVSGIEQETVINSMDIKRLSERMDRNNARNSEQFGEIKQMLKSLADKIDNLGNRRER